ncbi:Coenzyme F420 hydrogenase/dehydrogenase, beta subunit C-terminal domain [Butyrivibrio sp. AC2005]|uniref:Coenzyme F420 hydrogenase/dehydrogenase, beta subunit C-terminal domain n=1 Tax=Butyrivibrio sp. AC2005 TaxID=1280672 RepID=UPI0004289040|nr:Coenzyme F420 hydrogenase/dehydrogenase, beta subunit C-terminal domain [Butyrivibrio sp. AC2005]
MISLKHKKDCCGCGACYQICPKQCIDMRCDVEGFLYPNVDKRVCVDCHLCEKVCPILHQEKTEDKYLGSILAKNRSDIRLNSSSGGIFGELAKVILSSGGVVFGAAFDNKWMVHHIAIESVQDIPKVMGSKYLQSETQKSFIETKKYLEDGREVLYSGTACQISGLKAFLRKHYDNLYTVDVLCHGVPSPGIWERYLSSISQEYCSDIEAINFRDKISGWHNYSVSIKFCNGDLYSENYEKNKYMNMFLKDLILRPSCYSCKFKKMERKSDLTIGDAWNIENVMPELDDDKGTSICITHTDKGTKILDRIKDSLKMAEIELDTILAEDADSRKPVIMPGGRAYLFFAYRHNANFNALCRTMKNTKKNKLLKKIIRNREN